MKIGLDARSFGATVCGVARVTARLIEALSVIDRENQYFVFTDSSPFPGLSNQNFRVVQTRCPRMNPFYDLKFAGIAGAFHLDLFHSVHSWLPFGVGRIAPRSLVTIHDMFAVTDPSFFSKYGAFSGFARAYFSYLTARSVKAADMILTVSEYSKRRIQEVMPASVGKVGVVYNASGMNLSRGPAGAVSGVQGKYILYVGNCRSYKNVPTLIQAFSAYLHANANSDISLVIAGNDAASEIKKLVAEYGIAAKVIFYKDPNDKVLHDLYAGALGFVMPSKEEGFGIPVVEAMGMGVPVIISDADALTEVAGGAALIFPKFDHERLAGLIGQLVRDESLRLGLARRGLERSKVFTWKQSAEKLLSCYVDLYSAR
ncbi:MAG: glycosyltransferase family 1 protein [Nitrospiraceae bacterium]|nr:glycosyltransferase family 1 protein [Nitrospiraceae bacterium]